MTRSTMTAHIQDVAKDVWPQVRDALDAVTIRVTQLAGLSESARAEVEEYLGSHPNAKTKRAAISKETVWALARMGYLRSDEDAAVIAAAKRLVELEDDDDVTDLEIDKAHDTLWDSVKALPSFAE